MRTSRDAIRSLARYMSRAFGPDWEVGFFSEEGTFGRPGVMVKATGPQLSSGSRHTIDVIQPFAVYAYPAEAEGVEDTFDNAMVAEEIIWHAFNVGVGEGRPGRVPLFDYEGVPIDEPTSLRRYPDYMRVLDLSIDRAQAPEDEKKWTVTAELRLGWRRAGELPSGTRLAQSLRTLEITP
jgi:hypothetical protein